jgi:uncharacterized protein
MRIAISGASGLIGSALRPHLESAGHEMSTLVRSQNVTEKNTILWKPCARPEEQPCDPRQLDGHEVLIHLSGENVAGARWSATQKQRLRDSRLITTRNLLRVASQVKPPPRLLLCASAIGYYGDRGDELLTEDSGPGEGFLPEMCIAWEQAAQRGNALGMRVVNLRFGLVLSREGGLLKRMLLPFKLGVGGRLGSGRQYMSWIAIEDAVRAIEYTMMTDSLCGAVNITAPEPVTNAEFTHALGRALHRPTIFPVPGLAMKVLFGEMAEAILAGARVKPAKLSAAGFEFQYSTLQRALEAML